MTLTERQLAAATKTLAARPLIAPLVGRFACDYCSPAGWITVSEERRAVRHSAATFTGLPASRADDVYRRRRRWRTPVSSYITADMTCVLRIYHVWLGGTYNPINRFECTLTRNGLRLRRRSTNSAIARKLQLHVHSHKQTSCHRQVHDVLSAAESVPPISDFEVTCGRMTTGNTW